MATEPVGGPRILLNLTDLDGDSAAFDDLVASITKLAPKSPLFTASTTIQSEVTNLGTVYGIYQAACGVSTASAKQAKLDATATSKAKGAVTRSLGLLRTLTSNAAPDAASVATMGFTAYEGPAAAPVTLTIPEQIDQKPGKKGSGVVVASVHTTGPRRRFVAQTSTDGGATWVSSPGAGKSRKLTGKSGTSALVQFAMQRGQQQSPWSTAVTVTFP